MPKMNGKKRRSFNLKSFKMISIGMNIFLILCLTERLKREEIDFILSYWVMQLTYREAELSCLQSRQAHRKSRR